MFLLVVYFARSLQPVHAEKFIQKALDSVTPDPYDLGMCNLLRSIETQLCLVLEYQKKLTNAEAIWRKLLLEYQAVFCHDSSHLELHGQLLFTQQRLISNLCHQNRCQEAEILASSLLQQSQDMFDTGHKYTILLMGSVGEVMRKTQRFEASEAMFTKALGQAHNSLKELEERQSVSDMKWCEEFGLWLLQPGEFVKALSSLRRASAQYQTISGGKIPEETVITLAVEGCEFHLDILSQKYCDSDALKVFTRVIKLLEIDTATDIKSSISHLATVIKSYTKYKFPATNETIASYQDIVAAIMEGNKRISAKEEHLRVCLGRLYNQYLESNKKNTASSIDQLHLSAVIQPLWTAVGSYKMNVTFVTLSFLELGQLYYTCVDETGANKSQDISDMVHFMKKSRETRISPECEVHEEKQVVTSISEVSGTTSREQ